VGQDGVTEDGALAREQFSHALATRLQTISARRLAEKSGWGRTTVTEIKTGRQLPSAEQLEDLLTAAGADSEEIHTFQAALKRIHDVAAAPSSVAPALPAIPAEPGPPSPDPGASAEGAARPRGALIRRISIGVAAAVVGAYVAAMAWPSDRDVEVSGEVQCASGAPVVGIWIATREEGGSWARVRPGPGGFVVYSGTAGGEEFRLNVGCGGTPSQWRAEARSPWMTERDARLVCDDSEATISIAPYFGRCTTP